MPAWRRNRVNWTTRRTEGAERWRRRGPAPPPGGRYGLFLEHGLVVHGNLDAGIDLLGLLEIGLGLVELAHGAVAEAPILVIQGLHRSGLGGVDGLGEIGHGFGVLVLHGEDAGPVVVGGRVIGLEFDGLGEVGHGFVMHFFVGVAGAPVGVGKGQHVLGRGRIVDNGREGFYGIVPMPFVHELDGLGVLRADGVHGMGLFFGKSRVGAQQQGAHHKHEQQSSGHGIPPGIRFGG